MLEIPPLNSLRILCSVGKTGNITQAAKELNVSPSAVSQQIKNLEEWLGVSLFDRSPGSILLNATGQHYYEKAWQALALIAEATKEARGTQNQGRLVLSILPSFAAFWLVARLKSFQEQYPEIDLSIKTTNELVDFKTGDVDLAIRFGKGDYPGLTTVKLMEESSNIVCSPGTYAKYFREDQNPRIADLSTLPFVDDRGISNAFKLDLNSWMKSNGRSGHTKPIEFSFTDSHIAVTHVLQHDGFLLARRCVVEDLIRKGDLIAPFGDWIPEISSYFAVYPKHRTLRPIASIFLKWLKHTCRDYSKAIISPIE